MGNSNDTCTMTPEYRDKIKSAFNIVVRYGFCDNCRWVLGSKNCIVCSCYQNGVKPIEEVLFGE